MLTVAENVVLPVQVAGRKPDRDWVDEVLVGVVLAERYTDRPAELTAADQQRVAIARAVVSRPAILLADEPAAAVDTDDGVELLGLLRDCVDRYGQSIVICTRDEHAAAIADRAVAPSPAGASTPSDPGTRPTRRLRRTAARDVLGPP